MGARRAKHVRTGGTNIPLARKKLLDLVLVLGRVETKIICEEILPLMTRRQSPRKARKRHPDPTKDQVLRAKHLLENTNMAQQKIADMLGLGSAGRVSEILHGEWDRLLEDDK
jgi:hypothetical protein